jgi:transposase-like protein
VYAVQFQVVLIAVAGLASGVELQGHITAVLRREVRVRETGDPRVAIHTRNAAGRMDRSGKVCGVNCQVEFLVADQACAHLRLAVARQTDFTIMSHEVVEQFRNRPLEGTYPYVWLDAVYLKVRHNHRIVNEAVVLAIGARDTGEREILGFSVGVSEEEPSWQEFLRALVRRGLKGVQPAFADRLVISDAHEGLKAAITKALAGATWQRCCVHFMRNLLAHVPHGDKAMVAAAVRTIFAQPNHQAARQQLAEVVKAMHTRWPKAADLLASAEEDVLAYMHFPQDHWTRIYLSADRQAPPTSSSA